MMKSLSAIILEHYRIFSDEEPLQIIQLPASASERTYFRIFCKNGKTLLAAHNKNIRENNSFLTLTKHFLEYNLHVPEILFVSEHKDIYFLEDLGDKTLFSLIEEEKNLGIFPSASLLDWYKKAISQLHLFQTTASEKLPFQCCYPVECFDETSMLWDLNYFKYYFLKLSGIPFEEDLLEKDFRTIVSFYNSYKFTNFMFRDFQSRNIMLYKGKTYLIDYQGGRRGPAEYDLASCILDAKADLPLEFRNQIVDYFYFLYHQHNCIDIETFKQNLTISMLLRILQAFGAYGYRGYIQKKQLFIQSIPYASGNLLSLMQTKNFPFELQHLPNIFLQIIEKYSLQVSSNQNKSLTVTIYSFSYKKGIPEDSSEHGGGFVFDCRALPNPGRLPEFQTMTGSDEAVIQYLQSSPELESFLMNCLELVSQSVMEYTARGFSSLMVSFGCTGGQHRSVYCANFLAKKLKEHLKISIILIHRELINP